MDKELHIRLLHVGLFTIGKLWNTQNVYDSYWRFYINNCDGAEVELSDGSFPIRGSRIYLIPAWVRFNCRNVRPVRHFYVHFDVVGLSDHVVRRVFDRPQELSGRMDFNRFVRELTMGDEASLTTPAVLCRVKSEVYRRLGMLFDELSTERKEELSRSMLARHRFATTLQFIDDHLGQDLSNGQLAKASHMSESHFAHCFHDVMGQTPARYVLERRIAAAARLLIFSEAGIDRVSESVGFANRFHFSRNFARLMGVTPATYRKTTRV